TIRGCGSCIGFTDQLREHLYRNRDALWQHGKVSELLSEGKRKYESGDRMAALRSFETALAQAELSAKDRQAALYGSLAVHASFGDVELAQITLRGQ
ncbi:uncharacterized protein HaLaN_20629, partial [Haematococcus lacustris]